jgi:hypothetical protein
MKSIQNVNSWREGFWIYEFGKIRYSRPDSSLIADRPFPLPEVRSTIHDRTLVAITNIIAKAHGKSAIQAVRDGARGAS